MGDQESVLPHATSDAERHHQGGVSSRPGPLRGVRRGTQGSGELLLLPGQRSKVRGELVRSVLCGWQVVKELMSRRVVFRVLALSATPGNDLKVCILQNFVNQKFFTTGE